MKELSLFALTVVIASGASAQVSVNGYTKKDGTYVAPHQRTAPDSTTQNNYSTKGNVNPYTGKEGTVEPKPTQGYIMPPPQPAPQQLPAYQHPGGQSGYQQPGQQPVKSW